MMMVLMILQWSIKTNAQLGPWDIQTIPPSQAATTIEPHPEPGPEPGPKPGPEPGPKPGPEPGPEPEPTSEMKHAEMSAWGIFFAILSHCLILGNVIFFVYMRYFRARASVRSDNENVPLAPYARFDVGESSLSMHA